MAIKGRSNWCNLLHALTWFVIATTCSAEVKWADDCRIDLQALPVYLIENDAGAAAHMEQFGAAHFEKAMSEAFLEIDHFDSHTDCESILNKYLQAWRKGHLRVKTNPTAVKEPVPGSVSKAIYPDAPAPRIEKLSKQSILLSIKSFDSSQLKNMVNLLHHSHSTLATHPFWIIDVRGNDGGSDSTYEPLLNWLLADQIVDTGVTVLATPGNIEANQLICKRFGSQESDCQKWTAPIIARMQAVPSGSYVSPDDSPATQYDRVAKLEKKRPTRVAILMDDGCISSCEEFLLAVRQSFTVKLIGRRSAGMLDYSNLRPHLLPSGQRDLWYATSRSLRLPDLPVDVAGVAPDIYLPKTATKNATKEVLFVRNWLETGNFSLPSTKQN